MEHVVYICTFTYKIFARLENIWLSLKKYVLCNKVSEVSYVKLIYFYYYHSQYNDQKIRGKVQ